MLFFETEAVLEEIAQINGIKKFEKLIFFEIFFSNETLSRGTQKYLYVINFYFFIVSKKVEIGKIFYFFLENFQHFQHVFCVLSFIKTKKSKKNQFYII